MGRGRRRGSVRRGQPAALRTRHGDFPSGSPHAAGCISIGCGALRRRPRLCALKAAVGISRAYVGVVGGGPDGFDGGRPARASTGEIIQDRVQEEWLGRGGNSGGWIGGLCIMRYRASCAVRAGDGLIAKRGRKGEVTE